MLSNFLLWIKMAESESMNQATDSVAEVNSQSTDEGAVQNGSVNPQVCYTKICFSFGVSWF